MRYFDYATRNDGCNGCNGWDDIQYIGFPSVGDGTIYLKDGTTQAFDEPLAWALRAVDDGTWVEVFPFAQVNEYRENTTTPGEWAEEYERSGLAELDRRTADRIYGLLDEIDAPTDRDFLVTATIQVIVPARDRVTARLIMAEELNDFIVDSPYSNDVMNGLTIDDVEDLMEED